MSLFSGGVVLTDALGAELILPGQTGDLHLLQLSGLLAELALFLGHGLGTAWG